MTDKQTAPVPGQIEPYDSRVGDPGSKKFEALSYLPPMSAEEIRQQIDRALEMDWDCVIEHVEPGRASKSYWYMWKLPLFGERNVDKIMEEAAACHEQNPGHHVRISAIDKVKQTIGFALVTHRAA